MKKNTYWTERYIKKRKKAGTDKSYQFSVIQEAMVKVGENPMSFVMILPLSTAAF